MAMVVKNNMSAVSTLNTLNKNSSSLQKSLAKVSSGLKITSAQDDASGYAISERMRVRIRALDQATQNTQNGSSLMKTAEGALSSTIELLKTLKEKAINAATDTNTDEDRKTIQKEVNQFIDQIDDNALVTFNGKYLLEGSKSQPGIMTYTTMTNQSLDVNTIGTDKLTSLKNRKGESLEINSTDKVTASFVKDGVTYTTSYNVGKTTLNDIFKSLNEISATNVSGGVFGSARIVSGDDAKNPIYTNTNLAQNTINMASLDDLSGAFNAKAGSDFNLELAAMNSDAAKAVTDLTESAGLTDSDAGGHSLFTALRTAILDDLLTVANQSGAAYDVYSIDYTNSDTGVHSSVTVGSSALRGTGLGGINSNYYDSAEAVSASSVYNDITRVSTDLTVQTSTQRLTTGFVQIQDKDADGNIISINTYELYNPNGEHDFSSGTQQYIVNPGNHTQGTYGESNALNPDGYRPDGSEYAFPASFSTAADAIMEFIDEKLKEVLANGTSSRYLDSSGEVNSTTLLNILSEHVIVNAGGREASENDGASIETNTTYTADNNVYIFGGTETKMALTVDTATSTVATTAAFTYTTGTNTDSDTTTDANVVVIANNTYKVSDYANYKVRSIFVDSISDLVMSNDDVGIVPADKLDKTVDGSKGVTVTASQGGLAGQISGLTINITSSEGQNRKSVNEFLNAFETTIFAANTSSDHSLNIHVGAEANLSIAVGMADMRSEALGLRGSDGSIIKLSTLDQANAAISAFENALQKALDQQTTIGAIEARLEYTESNLVTSSENVQAAESTIRDADMAKEMTNYTKNNVLLQAAQSMLAQANQNSSAVLSLLQ